MQTFSFLFTLSVLIVSCTSSPDEKQSRAEASIRAFEQELMQDSASLPAKKFSHLEKKELAFDLSPEGNSFKELDSLGVAVLLRSFMCDSILLLAEGAMRKHDDKRAGFYLAQIDSLKKENMRLAIKEEELSLARDSVERILGKREFYHVTAHDSKGNMVGDYMLDTVTYAIRYWRYNEEEFYRKK